MRAKSERVYKPGAKEEWRVVYWIYPQEKLKNNRKQVSFSSIKYGDQGAQNKAWAVIRYINHYGRVPEDIKNPPMTLEACCNLCYPHCIKEHVSSCPNCVDPPTERYHHGGGSPVVSAASSSANPSPSTSSAVWRQKKPSADRTGSGDEGGAQGPSDGSVHARGEAHPHPPHDGDEDDREDDGASSLPDLTPQDSLSPVLSAAATCDAPRGLVDRSRGARERGSKSPAPGDGGSRRGSIGGKPQTGGATASPLLGLRKTQQPCASPATATNPKLRSASSSRRSSVSLRGGGAGSTQASGAAAAGRVAPRDRSATESERLGTDDADLGEDFASSPDIASVASSACSPALGGVPSGGRGTSRANPPFSPLLLPVPARPVGALESGAGDGARAPGAPPTRSASSRGAAPYMSPGLPPPHAPGDRDVRATAAGSAVDGAATGSRSSKMSPVLARETRAQMSPRPQRAWSHQGDQPSSLSLPPSSAFPLPSSSAAASHPRREGSSASSSPDAGDDEAFQTPPLPGRGGGAPPPGRSLVANAVQQLLSGSLLRGGGSKNEESENASRADPGRAAGAGGPHRSPDFATASAEERRDALASSAETLLQSLKKGAVKLEQHHAASEAASSPALASTAALLAAVALKVKERQNVKGTPGGDAESSALSAQNDTENLRGASASSASGAASVASESARGRSSPLSTTPVSPRPAPAAAVAGGRAQRASSGASGGPGAVWRAAGASRPKAAAGAAGKDKKPVAELPEDEDPDEQIQRLQRFLSANGIAVSEALQAAAAAAASARGSRGKPLFRTAEGNEKALASARCRSATGPTPSGGSSRCSQRARGGNARPGAEAWRPTSCSQQAAVQPGGPASLPHRRTGGGGAVGVECGSGENGVEKAAAEGEEKKDEGMVNVYQVYAQHILNDMVQSQVAGARDHPDPLKELLRVSNFFAIDAKKRLLQRTGGGGSWRTRRGDESDLVRSAFASQGSSRAGESPPLSPERRAESRAPTPPVDFVGAAGLPPLTSNSRARGGGVSFPVSGPTTRMTTRAATRASRGGCGGAYGNGAGGDEEKETPWMCNGVPVSCKDPFLSEDKDTQQYYNCSQQVGNGPEGCANVGDRASRLGLGVGGPGGLGSGGSGIQTRRQGQRSAAAGRSGRDEGEENVSGAGKPTEEAAEEEDREGNPDPTTFNLQSNSAIRQQKAALKLLREISQWGWKSIYEHEDFFLEQLVKKQLKTAERMLENEILKHSFPQLLPVLGVEEERGKAKLPKGRTERKDGRMGGDYGREARAWIRTLGDDQKQANGVSGPAEEEDDNDEGRETGENSLSPHREVRIEPEDFFPGCDSPLRWAARRDGDAAAPGDAARDGRRGSVASDEDRWKGELIVEPEHHMIHGPGGRDQSPTRPEGLAAAARRKARPGAPAAGGSAARSPCRSSSRLAGAWMSDEGAVGAEAPVAGSLCEATAKRYLENPEEYGRQPAPQGDKGRPFFISVAEALAASKRESGAGRRPSRGGEPGDDGEGFEASPKDKTPLSLECLARLLATAAAHQQRAGASPETSSRWRPRLDPVESGARRSSGSETSGAAGGPHAGAKSRYGTRSSPYPPAQAAAPQLPASSGLPGKSDAPSASEDGRRGVSLPVKAWLERLLTAARQTGPRSGTGETTGTSSRSPSPSPPLAKSAPGSSCASALIEQVTRLLLQRQEERRAAHMREVERKLVQMRDEQRDRARVNAQLALEAVEGRAHGGFSAVSRLLEKGEKALWQERMATAAGFPGGGRGGPPGAPPRKLQTPGSASATRSTGPSSGGMGFADPEDRTERRAPESNLSSALLAVQQCLCSRESAHKPSDKDRQRGGRLGLEEAASALDGLALGNEEVGGGAKCSGRGALNRSQGRESNADEWNPGRPEPMSAWKHRRVAESPTGVESRSPGSPGDPAMELLSSAAPNGRGDAAGRGMHTPAWTIEERGRPQVAGSHEGSLQSREDRSHFQDEPLAGVAMPAPSARRREASIAAGAEAGEALGEGRPESPEGTRKRLRDAFSAALEGAMPNVDAKRARSDGDSLPTARDAPESDAPRELRGGAAYGDGAGGASTEDINSSSSSGCFSPPNDARGPSCWTGEDASTREGSLATSFASSSVTLATGVEEKAAAYKN
ncbi:hypothetical protein BESB_035850 [Besnoitia besnoiti]|uniref:Uncharacterized protein n=1 Tax=Besnoitia besnoiti TaxID=94643 RepID=A0A2A9MMV0_BESBE|nr:hypothetical protein BESB_035850 [Besnoitia besnoiti]PFH37127.1 hypothetical protein BESB_035850 [Besnoitia besnoiti]